MWQCKKCGEKIDDQFDECWNCAEVINDNVYKPYRSVFNPESKDIHDVFIHLFVFSINAFVLYIFSISTFSAFVTITIIFIFHLFNFFLSSPNNIDGFVPLIIITILLSIAIPSYNDYREKMELNNENTMKNSNSKENHVSK